MSPADGPMTPAWLWPGYTHRCNTWCSPHRWSASSLVDATGICSSLPPWMMSSGTGLLALKNSGSFASSTFFQSGFLNGSPLLSLVMSSGPSVLSTSQLVSSFGMSATPAGVNVASSGASLSPYATLRPPAAMIR